MRRAVSRLLRLAPVVLLVSLAGCFPTVDVAPPERCDDVADAGVVPTADVLLVGEPAQVVLAVTPEGCLPAGVSATVRVDGPDGRRVPAEGTLETVGRVARVTVAFTPVVPGPHQVSAIVEPSVGAARHVVSVARLAQVSLAGRVDVPCAEDGLTASGAWLCLAGSQVTAWRDGMQLQALPASSFVVSGDVAWLLAPGQVERFVDSGGSFLLRAPDAALAFSPAGTVLARGDDELWDVSGRTVTRYALAKGALQRVGEAELPLGLCPASARLAVDPQAPALWLGCASREGAARLCRFDVPITDGGRCREVEGTFVGFDAGVLWLRDASGLRAVGLDGPGVTIALAPETRVASTPGGWPIVTTPGDQLLLPVLGPLQLELEVLRTRLPLERLTRELVIAGDASGRVAWRRTP